MTAHEGDWVRFYRGGQLVIGEVCYIERDTLGYAHYQTDVGEVREDSVLEVRMKIHVTCKDCGKNFRALESREVKCPKCGSTNLEPR